jgi:hypothetical protein
MINRSPAHQIEAFPKLRVEGPHVAQGEHEPRLGVAAEERAGVLNERVVPKFAAEAGEDGDAVPDGGGTLEPVERRDGNVVVLGEERGEQGALLPVAGSSRSPRSVGVDQQLRARHDGITSSRWMTR